MGDAYFLHQIKHNGTSGAWDKGIVVKDSGTSEENYDSAKQGFHAYLGAYAYGHDQNTDYVACYITNIDGAILLSEVDNRIPVEE